MSASRSPWILTTVVVALSFLACSGRDYSQTLDLQLVFDVAGRTDSSAKVTIDGKPADVPDKGYDIYVNDKLLGRDRVTITMDVLREHGVQLPLSNAREETPTSLVALLRGDFGLTGKPVEPEDLQSMTQRSDMLGAERGNWPALVTRVDFYRLVWVTANNLLDSFYVLIAYEKGSAHRLGALIRMRNKIGVKITGRSVTGPGQEVPCEPVKLHRVIRPNAFPLEVPQPKEGLRIPDHGTKGWWIEQFPAGADLPRNKQRRRTP